MLRLQISAINVGVVESVESPPNDSRAPNGRSLEETAAAETELTELTELNEACVSSNCEFF